MLKARVKIDLRRMHKLRRDIATHEGPVKKIQSDWVDIYRAFTVKRFILFSLGGGTWKPISERRAKKKGHRRILVDSRFLIKHLKTIIDVTKITSRSIIIGFKSLVRHPTAGMLVSRLAEIHHSGDGNNPERPILVQPDRDTIKEMQAAGKKRFLESLGVRT